LGAGLKIAVLVLAAAGVAFAVFWLPRQAAPHSPWGKGYLPNVEVVDQDNRKLRFYDDVLKGKIVVISFIYTSCKNICPLVIARLAEVKDMLGDSFGRDIHFVSISIDPIPDTPEKLKEHARSFQIGKGWTFLTGDPENIDRIRHKLGERSQKAIYQHRNEILLFNDMTASWARESPFSDINILANSVRAMDPAWQKTAAVDADARKSTRDDVPVELPGQALFLKTCASCHTIGGGVKVGPDLSGLLDRRSEEWIISYVTEPAKLRSASDPAALELRRAFPHVQMPDLGLKEPDAADLILYLKAHVKAADRDSAPAAAFK
jgi:protein SCO1/2